MAFNGSGTFTIDTPGNPVQPDTIARASVHNDTLTEIAAGLSKAICTDGQSVITQDIPFNSKRITNLMSGNFISDAASIGNIVNNTGSYSGTVAGTPNDITLSTFPAVGNSLGAGCEFWFVPISTNTGAVTVDVNSLGAKSLTKAGSIALVAGDIRAGVLVGMLYDGTRYQLMQPPYSHGSWTPTLGGSATYTSQLGAWTRIGRLVHIHMNLAVTTIGTGSTSVIAGLPFTSYNSIGDQALAIGHFSSLAVNVVWLGARIDVNANTITMIDLTAAGASAISSALIGDGTQIKLSGTYIAG